LVILNRRESRFAYLFIIYAIIQFLLPIKQWGRISSAPILFCFSAAVPAGTAAETFHRYGIAYHFIMLVMAVMAMPATAAATAFTAVVMLLFTARTAVFRYAAVTIGRCAAVSRHIFLSFS